MSKISTSLEETPSSDVDGSVPEQDDKNTSQVLYLKMTAVQFGESVFLLD